MRLRIITAALPKGLKVGDTVVSGAGADIKPGNAMPLSEIPVGTLIHAIEFQPGKGAAIARSAGTACQLMGKEGKYAIVRMPSSEMRRILVTCRATVGEVGNAEHSNIVIGKAGRKRNMGVRPTTGRLSCTSCCTKVCSLTHKLSLQCKHVVHGAGAMAQIQHGRKTAGNVGLCALHRCIQIIALCQIGRNGAG